MALQPLIPLGADEAPQPVPPKGENGSRYMPIVATAMLGVFVLFTYVSPLGYVVPATLAGVAFLGFWRDIKTVREPLLALGVLLVWAVSRATIPTGADFSQYDTWETQVWLKLVLQSVFYVPVVMAGIRLKPVDALKIMRWFIWAVVGLSALSLLEAISRAGLYMSLASILGKNIRPDLALVKVSLMNYGLTLVFWPMMLYLRYNGNRAIKAVLIAAAIIPPILTGANAPVLAMLVSGGIYLLLARVPKIGPFGILRVLGGAVFALLIGFPVLIRTAQSAGYIDIIKNSLPASWSARFTIWEFATDRLFEQPLMGWGFDTSRVFTEIPLHPHNLAIQTGLELGYIGLILLGVFWALLIRRVGERSESKISVNALFSIDTRPYMMATVSVFFVFSFLSFGLWQEWFLALAALSAFIALMAKKALYQAIKYQI